MALPEPYLAAIRGFEGYTPRAAWDYRQHSVGYGTRARHPGEVVDREEAERRLQTEVGNAAGIVDRFAPGLDAGARAALTSLTYNAGDAWTRAGLGQAIRAGDMSRARELFTQYNRAGGEVLPGLASRRAAEAQWFGAGTPQPSVAGAQDAGGQLPPTGTPNATPAPTGGPGNEAENMNIQSIVASLFGRPGQTTQLPQGGNPFQTTVTEAPQQGLLQGKGADLTGVMQSAAADDVPLRLPSMAPRRPVDMQQLRAALGNRMKIGV